jgi:hypothetical protein
MFQAAIMVTLDPSSIQLLEVIGSHVGVRLLVMQHVLDENQNAMADRDNRLLLALPACNGVILRKEIRIFHARDDPPACKCMFDDRIQHFHEGPLEAS